MRVDKSSMIDFGDPRHIKPFLTRTGDMRFFDLALV